MYGRTSAGNARIAEAAAQAMGGVRAKQNTS